MYLSRFAKSVTLLVRGDSLAKTMSQYLIDQIAKTPNIAVQFRSRVIEAKGNGKLDALTIANDETGEVKTVPAIALFIFIGAMPHTSAIADLIECDERGFILSGPDLIANGRRPRNWPLQA